MSEEAPTMPRLYSYVGDAELLDFQAEPPPRAHIRSAADVRRWVVETGQRPDRAGELVATFVVDADEQLWVADRHTEHIACARGAAVRAAGEITFRLGHDGIAVVAVTNQSTGYCPEPACWTAIEGALEQTGLPHPGGLTTSYAFRRCTACGTRNIVKDGWFECGVCQSELDRRWNF